jgi:hypothetical protein
MVDSQTKRRSAQRYASLFAVEPVGVTAAFQAANFLARLFAEPPRVRHPSQSCRWISDEPGFVDLEQKARN